MRRLLFFFVSIFGITVSAKKILIITHSHCRPDFIEMQARTFKAFLKEDYEFVVFNDAPEANLENAINQTCDQLGIRCLRVPQELHSQRGDAGARHIHGIQYSLHHLAFDHDGIVFLIDSDMFLIRPFSVKEYIRGYDFVGQRQERPGYGIPKVVYAAPLLILMDMRTLPNKRTINFDGGFINGEPCDVGGHTYFYFKDNSGVKVKFSSVSCIAEVTNDTQRLNSLDELTRNFLLILQKEFDDTDPHRMQFHVDNCFIHYVAGSNWNHRSQAYHERKTRLLNNFINEMIVHCRENC